MHNVVESLWFFAHVLSNSRQCVVVSISICQILHSLVLKGTNRKPESHMHSGVFPLSICEHNTRMRGKIQNQQHTNSVNTPKFRTCI